MKDEKIILVEDEAVTGFFIQSIFSKRGYQNVELIPSAEKTLEFLKLHKADLIITDINLGDGKMDGITMAILIRKKDNIPIIFLTAYTDKTMQEKCEVVHPLAFIHKPIQFSELFQIIEDYFSVQSNLN